MTITDHLDVIIIGGGFSGTMIAVNLTHQYQKRPLNIAVVNRGYPLGRGIAYSTQDKFHHLNVIAGKMSAFDSLPDHFVDWLSRLDQYKSLNKDLLTKTFLPRQLYGDYLTSSWEAIKCHEGVCSIEDEVESLTLSNDLYLVHLHSGKKLYAKAVVLATGNEVPGNASVENPSIFKSKQYFKNPWDPHCYKDIDPNSNVLIIGNGLTMIDTVLGLMENGLKGTIYSLSRNGLEILPHRPAGTVYDDFKKDVKMPYRLDSLFRDFNRHLKKLRTLGLTAEPLIDSIRPFTQKIWHSLSEKEKTSFLNHLRHYWGSARHRLPAHIHDKILHYQVTQKLLVMKGHLISANEESGSLNAIIHDRRTKSNRKIHISRIINCIGPESDITKSENTLLRNLYKDGLIEKNHVGLGICATPEGNVISAGKIIPGLYAIGNLMKGVLWECTAVPELRLSAEIISDSVGNYIQNIKNTKLSCI